MPVILRTETRRSETAGGVMTTLASPTQGDATRAIWRVEAHPGVPGPSHVFDVEQIWTFLTGGAAVVLDGENLDVVAGDTLVIPAETVRQVTPDADHGFTAIVTAAAGALAGAPGADSGVVPPWIV